MPQITLVPWLTTEASEFGTNWTYGGDYTRVFRAVSDGHHAASTISLGGNDSNSLRGYQWRVDGSGAAWSWANKTITHILIQVSVNNQGPEASAFFNFIFSNETMAYAESVFNGELASPVGSPAWAVLLNGMNTNVKNAFLADNFMFNVIHYNHVFSFHTSIIEAARAVITYTENIPLGGIMPMEC